MGKNLYETPRDRNKWQNNEKDANLSFSEQHEDNKAKRLDQLKARFAKQKKKK